MDNQLPDDRVRRDVDRFPQGLLTNFQTTCKGCHSILDGNGGAFAYYDRATDGNGRSLLLYTPGTVRPKFNQNTSVYPSGYVTNNDSWVNHATVGGNASIGWPAMASGNGAHEFGQMIANSEGYPVCMARRVLERMCRRTLDTTEEPHVQALAKDFKDNGYKLKRLFQKAGTDPICLPTQ
jgi:hypothetical protein